MNFHQALIHITREKRPKRACEWMKRFIQAIPTKYAEDKKFLKTWFTNQDHMTWLLADFYRSYFAPWKTEEKSRSAKTSRQHRNKPRRAPKKIA